ncbi:hypothetical protein BOTBODRAFT_150552 [Botryobasidium botryosum FD-172 SS1]|uniref:peptidyl-tRNA hydrolase n=1 Tax=Botryobasidium botryosum (strain FD-172 SS1) TaxID=930990 RepID=A0A067N3U5_BOTB1|nr:hypothetical protein BOTBODRAFT_150552 [Botryobasidium botryosum FD-172 SS1]
MSRSLPSVLVVGLGNYTHPLTRHRQARALRVGQYIIDSLATRLGIELHYDRSTLSWCGHAEVDISPPRLKGKARQTELLMNISGKAVALSLRSLPGGPPKPTPATSLLTIQDSIEHQMFKVAPKASGSANGHNGVRDTIAALGQDQKFARLRIGVGKPMGADVSKYVLDRLDKDELVWWGHGGKGLDVVWENVEKWINDRHSLPPVA